MAAILSQPQCVKCKISADTVMVKLQSRIHLYIEPIIDGVDIGAMGKYGVHLLNLTHRVVIAAN